jgi:AcrR family transcriptional regulator
MTEPEQKPDDTRTALLSSARELFLKNAYSNISIRKIADKAKVNSAMIAYYFGSKNGLFREVLSSYILQITHKLKVNLGKTPKQSTLEEFLLNFYKNIPHELAILVFRTLHMERGEMRHWLIENMLRPTLMIAEEYFEDVIKGSNKQDNAEVVRLVFQSLMLGPKLLEQPLSEIQSTPFDDKFYEEIAHFNAKLLANYFNLEK